MFEDLEGKNVLITGASSGIGKCAAELFCDNGAVVGVHYHSGKEPAEVPVRKIQKKGGDAFTLEANLLDFSSVNKLVPAFIQSAGSIEILINNAGGTYGHDTFLNMGTESWNKTLMLNLTAPFFLAKDSFTYMMEHNGGKIINISSIAAKYGGSAQSVHYGAAKSGLEAVTKSLARTGAQYNILVNAIRPGVINTPAHKKIGRSSLDERIKTIPLRRAGSPLDIARMCAFLGSECGDYITGQIYDISGGD